jgi:acetylornithine deacetylase/succinyl-diaminopimelate desuccinylase-like protein
MKTNTFKSIIKEAVREVIREELREILLEAVKAPKQIVSEYAPPPPQSYSSSPSLTMEQKREQYRNILGETAATFTTQNVAEFNPRGTMPGSDLPSGELSMNQIMNLMNK